MTFKEQVEAFKVFMRTAFADAPAAGDTAPADDLKSYTTMDGTQIKADKLEVGGYVYQEDGKTPVTSGFTLADGTMVDVGPDGVIVAVTVPVITAPAEPVLPVAADAAPAGPTAEERIATLESELAALKAAGAQRFADQTKVSESTEAKFKKYDEALSKVVDLMTAFGEQPSDDPAQRPTGKGDVGAGRRERREAVVNAIANRKAVKA